jgi:ethanolamine ammonia-lyase large subunit
MAGDMPAYAATLRGTRYAFADLKEVMAKGSPLRSGDQLAGIAAREDRERVAAQTVLADLPLARFLEEQLIPSESDEVTRLILDEHDRAAFEPVRDLTVGQFREWLLRYETTAEVLTNLAPGLTPEMVAAVSKICRNQDLILIASKCRVVTHFRNTLGLPGTLSVRLQPNHPTDDAQGIAASILDGLLYGAGDACIGVNPATDNLAATTTLLQLIADLIAQYEIPTQSCVLAHVTTTLRAIESGAPVDLVFQSIAGTEAANKSFGVDLKLLKEARDAALAIQNPRSKIQNPNVMYSKPARAAHSPPTRITASISRPSKPAPYAVARKFKPLLVNTVVGFIGPEYLVRRQANRPRRRWRTISAASCSACRWAWTSATPTTPRPIRTTWTRS